MRCRLGADAESDGLMAPLPRRLKIDLVLCASWALTFNEDLEEVTNSNLI